MDPLLAAEGKTLSVRAATSIGARPETLVDRHVPLARLGNGHDALDSVTCTTANTANTEVGYVVAALSPIITAVRRRPAGEVRNRMSIANRT